MTVVKRSAQSRCLSQPYRKLTVNLPRFKLVLPLYHLPLRAIKLTPGGCQCAYYARAKTIPLHGHVYEMPLAFQGTARLRHRIPTLSHSRKMRNRCRPRCESVGFTAVRKVSALCRQLLHRAPAMIAWAVLLDEHQMELDASGSHQSPLESFRIIIASYTDAKDMPPPPMPSNLDPTSSSPCVITSKLISLPSFSSITLPDPQASPSPSTPFTNLSLLSYRSLRPLLPMQNPAGQCRWMWTRILAIPA